jgi:hypothetical protein
MRKYTVLNFFLILIIIGLIAIGFIKVKEVICVSQFYACNESLRNKIDSINKGSLIQTRRNLIGLLKDEASVKSFSFQYQLDGKLILHINEREVKYCITNNGSSYYADELGKVIKIDNAIGVNCVQNTKSKYKIKDSLNNEDLISEQIYYRLRSLDTVQSGFIEDKKFVIEYRDGIKLIFPLEGQANVLIGRAYYTISQFGKINEYIIGNGFGGITEVDFRYNNPVIRYI